MLKGIIFISQYDLIMLHRSHGSMFECRDIIHDDLSIREKSFFQNWTIRETTKIDNSIRNSEESDHWVTGIRVSHSVIDLLQPICRS